MTTTETHPIKPDQPCPICKETGVLWVEYRTDPRPVGVWPWHVCHRCGHEEPGPVLPWCELCGSWHRRLHHPVLYRLIGELRDVHVPMADIDGCQTCWPADGRWPCITRRVVDELADALRDLP